MDELNFRTPLESETHECESAQEGEWIVYRCPICKDYERRINWRTKEMKVKNSNNGYLHSGSHSTDANQEILKNYKFIKTMNGGLIGVPKK
jgi:hypothetical protein